MKTLTLLPLLLLCLLGNAWGQTIKADILSTSTITLGESADEVRFMPEKLVSVTPVTVDGKTEYKTYIEPRIEFDKWNKEETLSISIPSVEGYTDKTVDEKTGEVVIRNKSEGFYFRQHDDSTMKFGIIWYDFPQSNSWTANLSGWEDLEFLYQPPLSKDNPTGRKLKPDGVTYFDVRPENVVGSYAIYHKTKKNYEIGKTNYGTGKFFHWYRPRFIDSLGNWTWGILVYVNGRMTETCPLEFLEKSRDNKAFPVRSNVDVGYAVGGGTSDWVGATQTGYMRVFGTPGNDGTLNYIYFCTSGYSSAKYALYSETGSKPNSRLCIDASGFTVAAAKGFHGNSVDYSYAITSGTQYWCGLEVTGAGEIYIYWDSGSDTIGVDNTDALPATAPDPFDYSFTNTKASVYFSYTASGGEATPRRRIILISKHENIHKHSPNLNARLGDCVPGRKKVFA